MKVKNLDFKETLVLAPLAGVSDVGMRFLCSEFGANATFTEMLSARAMAHNPKKTHFLTLTTEKEKIKIAQIFGKEPEFMAKACQNKMLEKFDGIDINMGCPAPKIIRNGEGSALFKDPLLASKVINACVNATEKPVSVKMRLGFDKNIGVDFARMCEESGASFITVHGRTQQELFSGKVNLEEIAKIKASVNIPVIGNGDVVDLKTYEEMLKTGVDGVMIGRGAQGKPWIFSEILKRNININVYQIAKKHVEILRKYFDEKWITLYLRKHFLWYISKLNATREQKAQIAVSDSIDKSLEIIKEITSNTLK